MNYTQISNTMKFLELSYLGHAATDYLLKEIYLITMKKFQNHDN